jgi:hypothetical protein
MDQWLKSGDMNSTNFHRIATHRKKIVKMEIEDELCKSLPTIQTHILTFYQNLFNQIGDKNS